MSQIFKLVCFYEFLRFNVNFANWILTEPSVRTEVMEQVPNIAMFCQENAELFTNPIPTYILPVIVKYLTDMNNLVGYDKSSA